MRHTGNALSLEPGTPRRVAGVALNSSLATNPKSAIAVADAADSDSILRYLR
ncbi:MAG: hypothetical protein L0228_20105 [Planctomycetes bacterium]|nr:hypothetical protein [Planctomycetota bacterium]